MTNCQTENHKTVYQLGLIGKTLTHSFSKKYFGQKFKREGITNVSYDLYELSSAEKLMELLQDKRIVGLNVTIPYKQDVIPLLDEIAEDAEHIGAVNTIIRLKNGGLRGHNTDIIGFRQSLVKFLDGDQPNALILGTGGACKAAAYVLEQEGMSYLKVSRNPRESNEISYADIDLRKYKLIINTTPLGTFPEVDAYPDIPYKDLTASHFLFDMVYNPSVTTFMQKGLDRDSKVINGLEMLEGQAEAAWDIWCAEYGRCFTY